MGAELIVQSSNRADLFTLDDSSVRERFEEGDAWLLDLHFQPLVGQGVAWLADRLRDVGVGREYTIWAEGDHVYVQATVGAWPAVAIVAAALAALGLIALIAFFFWRITESIGSTGTVLVVAGIAAAVIVVAVMMSD